MVRRWSYIVSSPSNTSFYGVRRAHAFKVFRKTTKFKRFNRGLVDFVRRKNVKRKKAINLLTISYSSYSWSKYYLNLRSISRFSQSLFSSEFTFVSLNPELTLRLSSKLNFRHGIHTLSLPTKRGLNIIKRFYKFNLDFGRNLHSRGALLSTDNFTLKHNEISKLGASEYLELSSRYLASHSAHIRASNSPLSFLLSPSLLTVSNLRQILILTTLLTLSVS